MTKESFEKNYYFACNLEDCGTKFLYQALQGIPKGITLLAIS